MEIEMGEIVLIFTSVVTGASIICKGLELIARKTKTKADDVFVGKLAKVINAGLKLLNFCAVNQKK